jgi:transcriptional regulator with XRE-family HTH domain
MAEQNMCRMTQLRLRYGISQADLANAAGVSRQLISLIELDTASQSKGHEALIRRAFSAVIASRRAALAHELDAAPWLFSMSKEDDEHGF